MTGQVLMILLDKYFMVTSYFKLGNRIIKLDNFTHNFNIISISWFIF
jgi:hypothetical protein